MSRRRARWPEEQNLHYELQAFLSNHKVFNLSPVLTETVSPETPTLLAQAQTGDPEAFGVLCRAFESRLLRQAFVLCGDPSLAEDLAQETLVEAWKCLGRYNEKCQFFTWLCAILHNRYRNVLRRKRFFVLFGLGRADREEIPDRFEQQPDETAWPDAAVESREQAALVRKCVQDLPVKHQQIIYLRFFVDDSLEGIAVALGCSIGTVKSRLFHALDKLRAMRAINEQRSPWNPKILLL